MDFREEVQLAEYIDRLERIAADTAHLHKLELFGLTGGAVVFGWMIINRNAFGIPALIMMGTYGGLSSFGLLWRIGKSQQSCTSFRTSVLGSGGLPAPESFGGTFVRLLLWVFMTAIGVIMMFTSSR